MRRTLARRQGLGRGSSVSLQRMATERPLLALSGLGAGYYETAATGGESGVATGFGFVVLCRLWQNVASATRAIIDNFYTSPVEGFTLNTTGSNTSVLAAFVSGAAASTSTPTITLSPSDNGRILALVGQHTAAGVRLSVYRGAFTTSTAITGYAPCARKLSVGRRANVGNLPADGVDLIAWETFRGLPSDAQIWALLDEARRRGDLPGGTAFSALFAEPPVTSADIAAMAPTHRFRAADATAPGGSLLWPSTGSAGGALAIDAGTLAAPSASSLLNGKQALVFTGTQRLKSNLSAAAWAFLHDGSPYEIALIYAPTSFAANGMIVTNYGASATAWTDLYFNSAPAGVVSWRGFAPPSAAVWDRTTYSSPLSGGAVLRASFATSRVDLRLNGNLSTAATAVTPGAGVSGPLVVGMRHDGVWPAQMHLAEIIILPRRATDEEGAKIEAYARQEYGVGAVALTHRWSAREAIGTAYNPVGRKTYGVTGFSATNRLETASGAGIAGVFSGFHVACRVFFTSLTGSEVAAGRSVVGTSGWIVYRNAAVLQFVCYTGSSNISSPSYTLTSGDLNVPRYVYGVLDGTRVRLFVDGVEYGNPGTLIGAYAAAAQPTGMSHPTLPFAGTAFELAGGHTVPTPAEIAQNYADSVRVGTLQPMPNGKTEHLWRVDQDIVANGYAVPVTVLDRVGTDHLTRVGGLRVQSGGLTSFGASGYPQSATVASGLPGIAGAIWVEDLLVAPATPPTAIETVFSNTGISSNGLNLRMGTDGRITARYGDGSTFTDVVSPSALTAGDHHVATYYDGSVGHLFVDGVLVASSAAFAYQPGSQPTKLGTNYAGTSTPALTTVVKGASGGHVVPTIGEIAAASAYALANGRVGGIAGKTLRRYDVVQDIAEAGGKVPTHIKERVANVDHLWVIGQPLQPALAVDTGPAAPSSLPDTVTGAGIDTMSRVGAPSVASIDTTVDGRKTCGALGFSTTSRLETVSPGGTAGAATGFWFGGWFNPRTLSGNQTIIGRGDAATGGYHLFLSGASLQPAARSSSGSNIAGMPSTTLPAGVPVHAVAWLDGASTWRLAVNGVAVGTPLVSAVGYLPYVGPMSLGSLGTLFPASGVDVFGGGAGMGVISLAQVQESARATIAAGRWVPPATGNGNSYDLTADILANGGPGNGVPLTVQDRVGTDHLTRVGGLEVSAGGLAKFTASNTVSTPGGVRGNPAGFWAEVLFNSLTGATDARVMGTIVGATSGWSIYSYGTAALVNFSDGVAVRSSAFITIADNTRTHIAIRHTGTAMETYVNGTLSHTATFPAVAAAAGPMYLGAAGASSQPVLGGSGGDGIVPTPAEIATAAAAALAAGKVVGIPGKTPKRWSVVDDVGDAGGKVPVIVRDRVGTDHAAVVNTKLEAAQRAERVWGYEASPILSGIATNGAANHYVSTTGGAREVAGWGGTLVFVPRPTSTVVTRDIVNSLPGTLGWRVVTSATNSTIGMSFANGVGTHVAPASIAIAAFVNKLCCYTWQWTGTLLRVFLNRVETGSGTTIAGHMPSDGPIRLGWTSASDNEIFGLVLWDGVASAPQVQAQHDAIFANDGRVQPMPDAANALLVDPTRDALANGGVLGASIQDRIGANHFTRVGSPATAAQYARAFGV